MLHVRRHSGGTASWAALACLALALLLCSAAPAGAFVGEYEVEVCTSTGNATGHGLAFHEQAGSGGFGHGLCVPLAGKPTLSITSFEGSVTGLAEWTISAPPGAAIRSVHGNRRVVLNGIRPIPESLQWLAFPADSLAPEFERFPLHAAPRDGLFTWTPAVPTPTIHGRILCQSASTCENKEDQEQVLVTDVVALVVDQSSPTVTTGGPLFAEGTARGTEELTFQASDAGAGVAKVSLVVDGIAKDSKTDTNGGLCAAPFHAMAPCAPEIDSSFDLDTTTLAEGAHKVEVVVEDGSGRTSSAAATVLVHNRPTNTEPPTLSGSANIGETVAADTGEWEGSPDSFSYQWLRCPPGTALGEEAGCTALIGATQAQYAVAAAIAGSQLVARVTATNRFGAEAVLSAPTDVVPNLAPPVGPGADPAPETRIAKHPRKKTAQRVARFTFSSNRPASSFQCRLDKAAFKPCRTPFKHRVKPGRHSFQVRAVDASGAADATPALFRWRVSKR